MITHQWRRVHQLPGTLRSGLQGRSHVQIHFVKAIACAGSNTQLEGELVSVNLNNYGPVCD